MTGWIALALVLAVATPSTPSRSASQPAGTPARFETATFAMGCFWCAETGFETLPGVQAVVSGYTGGPEKNPTYEEVSSGSTGHLESIEIRFDPARVGYAKLLDIFWHSIDPTQGDGQFCDHGAQYRSAIFYHGETQRRLAEQSKKQIEASGQLKQPIVTRIVAGSEFYVAEGYHQDFWKKDPLRYRTYRAGCGRDRRLSELWGKSAAKPLVH